MIIGSGPTVDEQPLTIDFEDEIEDYSLQHLEDEYLEEEITWTPEEEYEAKTKHIHDVIDANDSYDVISTSEKGSAQCISTTWVTTMRDEKLKARLCARDFAKTKRQDLFRPKVDAVDQPRYRLQGGTAKSHQLHCGRHCCLQHVGRAR